VIVNGGTIDGRVAIPAGTDARFENSGWLGISAPGVGTVHTIGGTFAQTAVGTLVLRVAGDGSHDALRVLGTAQLAGALTLVPQPGLYGSQTIYPDLVSATDALRGGFATVSTTSAFLQASLIPAPNSLSAVLTRTPFDALPGLTPNQQAIGVGLERGYGTALVSGAGAGFYSNLLTSQISPAAVAGAYDAIGGEGVTGVQQTTFAAASRFVEAMREQGAFWLSAAAQGGKGDGAADPPGSGSARLGIGRVWAGASGAGGHLDSDHALGAAALSSQSWGGAAGFEIAVSPDLLLGIAGGGSGSNFSVSQRATSGSVDGGAARRLRRGPVERLLWVGRLRLGSLWRRHDPLRRRLRRDGKQQRKFRCLGADRTYRGRPCRRDGIRQLHAFRSSGALLDRPAVLCRDGERFQLGAVGPRLFGQDGDIGADFARAAVRSCSNPR
jgi:hypothetical protein